MIKIKTVFSKYFVKNGQKTGILRSISVTSNEVNSPPISICKLFLLEIVEMNHQSKKKKHIIGKSHI